MAIVFMQKGFPVYVMILGNEGGDTAYTWAREVAERLGYDDYHIVPNWDVNETVEDDIAKRLAAG